MALLISATGLAAQTTVTTQPPPAADCSVRIVDSEGKPGAPACSPEGRLAFLVRGEGMDISQLWIAVESGAAQRGVSAIHIAKALPADSMLYAMIEVTHSGASGYRIDTHVAGSKAQSDMCPSFGGTIPDDWPVVLGAMVSSAAQRLTRCVQPLKLALHP
jgi:hypothetical protein